MAFNGQGALAGAGSGAMAGGMMGGPWGALIGAGVGAVGGGFLGGTQGQGGFSKDDINALINRRNEQIGNFTQALATARNTYYNTTLPNFQNYAFSRFTPRIEAQFAGRGLQPSGGAFAGALARQATDFTQQQQLGNYQDTRADLNTINNAYGQNFGSALGAQSANFQGYQPPNPTTNALMGFAGQAGMAYMGNKFNQSRDQNFINMLMKARGNPNQGSVVPEGVMG